MGTRVPTSRIERSASDTKQQLEAIKKRHESAESAADRGFALEQRGDTAAANKAFRQADIANEEANGLAVELQLKIGPNHTVNSDGTITIGKSSGDGFRMEELRAQEAVAEATGLSMEDVVMGGGGSLDEALVVIEENRAEQAEASTQDFIDGLLRDASIDPALATDEDVQNVVDREVLEQEGVLDMIRANGGDPDAMTPEELVQAALDEVGYAENEATGVPSIHDPDGGLGDAPSTGAGVVEDPVDPFEGTGFDVGRPDGDPKLDDPRLDGGDPLGDPLGAGAPPAGSDFGGPGGGRGGAPGDGRDEGLGHLIPGGADTGQGGPPGGGTGGSSGGPGAPGAPPGDGGTGVGGENPLEGWNPGSLGGSGGAGPGQSGGSGGGSGQGGAGQGGSGQGDSGQNGGAAGGGGSAPGGSGGGSAPGAEQDAGLGGPSGDDGEGSGLGYVGEFAFDQGADGGEGGAYDVYMDENGNFYADTGDGLQQLNEEDSGAIADHIESTTGTTVEEYADALAAQNDAAAAADEAGADDPVDEDYAEPPPVENPYVDDPTINAYLQQEANAEAGADIDYGDHDSGLAYASQPKDIRPDQIDYGGPMATPADPGDVPMDEAQSGVIDPSPLDDVGGGGSEPGGYDAHSEVAADLKEAKGGGDDGDGSAGGGSTSSADGDVAFGAGASVPAATATATSGGFGTGSGADAASDPSDHHAPADDTDVEPAVAGPDSGTSVREPQIDPLDDLSTGRSDADRPVDEASKTDQVEVPDRQVDDLLDE